MGAYWADAGITAAINAKLIENSRVEAISTKVVAPNGEVLLSGFAKDLDEKATTEPIARNTKGVKRVKNEISLRA